MEKQPSLGILGIIKEALKTTTLRNGKPMLSILLFIIYYLSILEVCDYLLSEPVLEDMSFKLNKLVPADYNNPSILNGIIRDARLYCTLQIAGTVFSGSILLFFSVAAVYSTYESHTAKATSLNDAILGAIRRWNGVFVTFLYAVLISLGALVLFLLIYIIVQPLLVEAGAPKSGVDLAVLVSGLAVYVYLSALWVLSLVVSTLEEGRKGLCAICRALEVMKGKRFQTCWCLKLISILCSCGVLFLVWFLGSKMRGGQGDLAWRWRAIGVLQSWTLWLVELGEFVVFTVFYCELRKQHEGKGWQKGGVNAPIPSIC